MYVTIIRSSVMLLIIICGELKSLKCYVIFSVFLLFQNAYFHWQIRQKIVYENQVRWNVHMCVNSDSILVVMLQILCTTYTYLYNFKPAIFKVISRFFFGYFTNCSNCLCRQFVIASVSLFLVCYLPTLAGYRMYVIAVNEGVWLCTFGGMMCTGNRKYLRKYLFIATLSTANPTQISVSCIMVFGHDPYYWLFKN
jgi:hypothetical protein